MQIADGLQRLRERCVASHNDDGNLPDEIGIRGVFGETIMVPFDRDAV